MKHKKVWIYYRFADPYNKQVLKAKKQNPQWPQEYGDSINGIRDPDGGPDWHLAYTFFDGPLLIRTNAGNLEYRRPSVFLSFGRPDTNKQVIRLEDLEQPNRPITTGFDEIVAQAEERFREVMAMFPKSSKVRSVQQKGKYPTP